MIALTMKPSMRIVLVLACLASACSRTPPETQIVNDAATALGGKDRILAVKALTMQGTGDNPNIGQNVTPDAALGVWRVTDFTRAIDLANGRMKLRQVRSARFPYALATLQRQNQGLDGDVAFNVGDDGAAARASDAGRCAIGAWRCCTTRSLPCVPRSTRRQSSAAITRWPPTTSSPYR